MILVNNAGELAAPIATFPFVVKSRATWEASISTGCATMMLAVLGDSKYLTDIKGRDLPVLGGLTNLLGLYIVAPRLVNTVSVAVQCGLNDCHTFGYQFLQ